MNFFIAAIGRSGTTWLAQLLDSSASHTCRHEDADPRSKTVPHAFTPFPAERFLARGPLYGECSGMLRYHLSAGIPNGKDKLIPRRAWLRRNPVRVITSWMNSGCRAPEDLSAVCLEVLWHFQNLSGWVELDDGARIVDLERVSTSPARLQEFVDWLGVELVVTEEKLRPRNSQPPSMRKFRWNRSRLDTLRRCADHLQLSGVEEWITAAGE